jgi:hypothetical protein
MDDDIIRISGFGDIVGNNNVVDRNRISYLKDLAA